MTNQVTDADTADSRSNKILVAYATRYGSTQEVVESIAATLRESGLEVDIRPAREVRTLKGYDAVVLGAPIFIGKWHKDARRFLSRHQKALTQRSVAIFALGPIQPDEKSMQISRAQLDKQLTKYPWLTPDALEMFVGKYDPARLTFPHNLMTKGSQSPLHNMPTSDHRDWDAIHDWAANLPAKLQL